MDLFITFALSAIAFFGLVATIAGVESRDGFDWREDHHNADALR